MKTIRLTTFVFMLLLAEYELVRTSGSAPNGFAFFLMAVLFIIFVEMDGVIARESSRCCIEYRRSFGCFLIAMLQVALQFLTPVLGLLVVEGLAPWESEPSTISILQRFIFGACFLVVIGFMTNLRPVVSHFFDSQGGMRRLPRVLLYLVLPVSALTAESLSVSRGTTHWRETLCVGCVLLLLFRTIYA